MGIPLDIVLYFHLSRRIFGTHVADLAEYGSLRSPGPVMPSQNPEDTAVRVGITAVEGVLIVKLDHDFKGMSRGWCPLEDLFAPEHPEIVVYSPLSQELYLGGVP